MSEAIWVVAAEFASREDATAFMDLARELGYSSHLSSRQLNVDRTTPAREWRIGKVMLRSMVPRISYDADHFRAVLQENGFAPSSYSPILSLLTKQGDVVRVAPGVWQLSSPAT